jgi:hypothetical protein
MSDSTTKSTGISFGGLLFIVLLVLKLTHYIDWSWWWITAPLWGGLAIFLGILLIGIIITIIVALFK